MFYNTIRLYISSSLLLTVDCFEVKKTQSTIFIYCSNALQGRMLKPASNTYYLITYVWIQLYSIALLPSHTLLD